MKVYIVGEQGWGSEYTVLAVYVDELAARAFVENAPTTYRRTLEIVEWNTETQEQRALELVDGPR